MQIEILGCGGAFDDTSTAYLVDDTTLIDCGVDVVKRLAKRPTVNIRRLLLTHIHQDHVGGIEALLYHRVFVQNNRTPIIAYAPDEFATYFKTLAVYKDFGMSLLDLRPAKSICRPLNSVVLDATPEVTSFEVVHAGLECFGYLVRDLHSGRYVIFSGDSDTVLPNISIFDCDLAYVFHDMGWTGLPPDHPSKVHPTEDEVFARYGSTERIIGIHTSKHLQYYRQARTGHVLGVL